MERQPLPRMGETDWDKHLQGHRWDPPIKKGRTAVVQGLHGTSETGGEILTGAARSSLPDGTFLHWDAEL